MNRRRTDNLKHLSEPAHSTNELLVVVLFAFVMAFWGGFMAGAS